MSALPEFSTSSFAASAQLADAGRLRKARIQNVQDFLFHKITLLFALSVLITLIGILASLVINAWPTLHRFGPAFFTPLSGTLSAANLAQPSPSLARSRARVLHWPLLYP
jgi:hypothetical protein